MIEFRDGDILKSGARSLVSPVDCSGSQGKGLALFAKWAPYACGAFRRQCPVLIGELVPILALEPCKRGECSLAPLIYFFPTKRHWRESSRIEDIEKGLDSLVSRVRANAVTNGSIAVPMLGCGLGGLDWTIVRPLVVAAAESVPEVHWMIYGTAR